jgi:hypothetical protein
MREFVTGWATNSFWRQILLYVSGYKLSKKQPVLSEPYIQ